MIEGIAAQFADVARSMAQACAAGIRRAFGGKSPSREALAGRVPLLPMRDIDPHGFMGRAPLTIKAKKRRMRKKAERAAARL